MTTTAPAPVTTNGNGRRRFSRNKTVDVGGGQGAATPLAKGVVWFICFLWIMPIVGTVITSFRPKDDANANAGGTSSTTPVSPSRTSPRPGASPGWATPSSTVSPSPSQPP